MAEDWSAHLERQERRYRDGEARLPDDPDARQRQLTRMGNAAGGAGLALLMAGRQDEAGAGSIAQPAAIARATGSRRPVAGAGRSARSSRDPGRRLAGAEEEARWALAAGAAETDSPIGRYAGALALLTLGRDEEARPVADSLRERDDFPHDVADALATLAAEDVLGYTYAVESVLESFEQRDEYLEDMPVADTVIVLQALASRRDMAAELTSDLLP